MERETLMRLKLVTCVFASIAFCLVAFAASSPAEAGGKRYYKHYGHGYYGHGYKRSYRRYYRRSYRRHYRRNYYWAYPAYVPYYSYPYYTVPAYGYYYYCP